MTSLRHVAACLCLLAGTGLFAMDAPLILTNHLGYERYAANFTILTRRLCRGSVHSSTRSSLKVTGRLPSVQQVSIGLPLMLTM